MIDSIKEDGDFDLNNSNYRIEKKKEHTNFTALVVDSRTKKVIRRINFNIAIEIPVNTSILYKKQTKKYQDVNNSNHEMGHI